MAEKELPPPKLLVPRAEAAQKIKAQIEKGYAIRDMDVSSVLNVEKAESEQQKWHSYNEVLLSRLFDNTTLVEEYKSINLVHTPGHLSTLSIYSKEFHRYLDRLVAQLEIFLLKVEFIPEAIPANTPSAPSIKNTPLTREVFIVHGHDEAAKEGVARVLSQLDLKPIILNEKADAGLTIIEKFEKHANVAFAVILLTPDDIGSFLEEPDQQKPRARQNVILEFGYFLGKLGRGKVCALYKEGVELPSDLYGILYVSMDVAGAWKFRLAKEINQAGIKVDINVLLAD